MNKIVKGLLFGAIAGVIDVIPMIAQGLSWDANLSAFIFWVVSGFMIAASGLKINPIAKGVLISYLLILPILIIVGAKEPVSLVPICIMTLILGGGLGKAISSKD